MRRVAVVSSEIVSRLSIGRRERGRDDGGDCTFVWIFTLYTWLGVVLAPLLT